MRTRRAASAQLRKVQGTAAGLETPAREALEQKAWMRQKCAVGLGFFAGLALSHHLWFGARVFPLAPVVSGLGPLPAPLDAIVYAAMLVALAAIAFIKKPVSQLVWWMLAFGALFACMAVTDQMRWQPWAYQYLWMLAALGWGARSGNFAGALNACRLVLACTYFWSGMQKLNSDFVEAVFPVFAQPLTALLPASAAPLLTPAAWGIAILEASFGIGLLVPRLRKVTVIAAVAMHLIILFALGPWGQSFNSVVWPWNIVMIASLVNLFGSGVGAPNAGEILWPRGAGFPKVALAALGLLPALSLINLWDAYLSFALYSGVSNIAYLRVADAAAERMPKTIQTHLLRTQTPGVNQLRLTDWSYAELNVPVNAEPRVYRAIARSLCQYEKSPEEVQLFVFPRHRLRPHQPRLEYGCVDLTGAPGRSAVHSQNSPN